MRNVLCLLIIGLSLSLFGCKNSAEQKAAEQKALKEKKDAEKAERIKKLKMEEARSLNIWKDVKFGMTRKQVLETNVFKSIGKEIDDFEVYGSYIIPNKELSTVKFNFGEKSDRLYSIDFLSRRTVTADHIDDMEEDCHRIISVMEEGFKEKLEWEKSEISILDFNEGKEFELLSVYYGQVSVWVKMGETYKGSQYYYLVTAFCSNYSN